VSTDKAGKGPMIQLRAGFEPLLRSIGFDSARDGVSVEFVEKLCAMHRRDLALGSCSRDGTVSYAVSDNPLTEETTLRLAGLLEAIASNTQSTEWKQWKRQGKKLHNFNWNLSVPLTSGERLGEMTWKSKELHSMQLDMNNR